MLKADFDAKQVVLKVIGKNPTLLAGQILMTNGEYMLGPGDTFELVSGYRYHTFFGIIPNLCVPDSAELLQENSPSKRIKFEECLARTTATTVHTDVHRCDTLLIIRYGPQQVSPKIAGFDLDGTIIETASGKRFAKDSTDWKLRTNVKWKLREIKKSGYKIVIFTNQGGIAKGKLTIEDFTSKLNSIVSTINVPILVLASTAQDIHRKPCIGMWNYLMKFENGNILPELSSCFYVGDAAGRTAEWEKGRCH